MNEVEIVPVEQSLVRSLIQHHRSIPLATLAELAERALLAVEKHYWRQLYDAGIVNQWKAAIRTAFSPDGNGARTVVFGSCVTVMDKHSNLTIKREAVVIYDDREIAQERLLPGEWMVEFEAALQNEAERIVRIKERAADEAKLAQIERLKA